MRTVIAYLLRLTARRNLSCKRLQARAEFRVLGFEIGEAVAQWSKSGFEFGERVARRDVLRAVPVEAGDADKDRTLDDCVWLGGAELLDEHGRVVVVLVDLGVGRGS